jgi:TRAP-type C4-dicarboxylate transport system permease small subunit
MNTLKAFFRLRSWEGLFNNFISSFLLIVMMLLVVTNVTGRYLFERPLHGTIEITEFIMVTIVYFTLSHTQAIKSHIRVEFLLGVMPRRMKIVFDLITYVFGLTIFALITWQGVLCFIDSWEIREMTDGYIEFPIYPAKLTIPVGCFIFSLRFIADIIDAIRHLLGKDSP